MLVYVEPVKRAFPVIRRCVNTEPVRVTVDGAFAEYMKIDEKQLLTFSDDLSFEEAAFTEPMACVATALLERTKVMPEDIVVVFGPGPIGLLAAQMAKIYGASKVIVVGTAPDKELRLPLAKNWVQILHLYPVKMM